MTIWQHRLRRRTFFKILAQSSVLIGLDRSLVAANPARAYQTDEVGYGLGEYGAGEYPAQTKVYLPTIITRGDE